jgi:hypothetical protein
VTARLRDSSATSKPAAIFLEQVEMLRATPEQQIVDDLTHGRAPKTYPGGQVLLRGFETCQHQPDEGDVESTWLEASAKPHN